jgi:hypothetical protein
MRITIAISAALIASTAVAEDAVHLRCTGTEVVSGVNNNVPYSVEFSIVVKPGFVDGDVVGEIIRSDDQSVTFMSDMSVSDSWRAPKGFDVCSYGTIDRVTGKVRVEKTYGTCNQRREPSVRLYSVDDLVCKVVKQRLF